MSGTITRWSGLLPLVLLLTGCDMQSNAFRIGLLVLVPFVLIVGVFLWLSLRRDGGEDNWEKQHFPDQDDDDNEDHFLM